MRALRFSQVEDIYLKKNYKGKIMNDYNTKDVYLVELCK